MKMSAPTPNLAQRDHVRAIFAGSAGIREAPMFGCPAFFFGRRMVACIYGDEVGIKLPKDDVDAALTRAGVVPFRPYGKAMREWVALRRQGADLDAVADLLVASLAHARTNA